MERSESVRQPDGDPGTEPEDGGRGSQTDAGTGTEERREQPGQEERQGGYGDSTGGEEVAGER
jgi:hypothetical protein